MLQKDIMEKQIPFFKIGIVFKITEDENMSARYINARSARGFCGMNSTIEGIWTRKS